MNAIVFLTAKEAAELLKVSESTIRRWIAEGRLPSLKTPNGRHRIPSWQHSTHASPIVTEEQVRSALSDDAMRSDKPANLASTSSGMAPLPDDWGQTLTGEPMPDVARAVRRSRRGH